jgi:aminomethyltransferase
LEKTLKQTPLNAEHRALGGKMVDFGGWEMPVQYPAGVIEEHLRTRAVAGLFDVSHMGEIHVDGRDAIRFVNLLTTNDVAKLVDGQAQYSALTNERGGVIDDLLVYRFAQEKLLLVVNATTQDKDWDWICSHRENFDVDLRHASVEYCQIAIQGPRSTEILSKLTATDLNTIKYYHFAHGAAAGVPSVISRTGYTGEDGFEIYAPAENAAQLWEKLLEAGNYGASDGILPCGLAARNTLRLEAAMSLYGHELDEEITPLEASLSWICKFDKGAFIGREALLAQKENGLKRKLIGFEMIDKGIARDDYAVAIGGKTIGRVTSGSFAPFLKKNIGLAFAPIEFSSVGQEIEIDVRGKLQKAVVVSTPFYKREKK